MKRLTVSARVGQAIVAGMLFLGCGDDSTAPSSRRLTSYDDRNGWDCSSSETCQDVFDIEFAAGARVTFQATETTGESVLQVALYAPGVALGGTNLFTETTNELRCFYVDDCDENAAGQTITDFDIPAAGVYRLAVTRDGKGSCGGAGTYRLIIHSNKAFSTPVQTVDDVLSLASGWECP